jgi:hypothetical protein
MKVFTNALIGFLLSSITGMPLHAQVSLGGFSYVQNFDGLGSGLPQGWSVRIGASTTALGSEQTFNSNPTSWSTSTAGFRNVAASEAPLSGAATTTVQEQSGDRALGLRQTAAFGDSPEALPAFTFQIANTIGIGNVSLSFKLMQVHQLASPQRTVNWIVEYGLGNTPITWVAVPTTPAVLSTTQGIWGSTEVQVNFGNSLDNINENVWIRIRAAGVSTGSNSRPHTAIDDFVLNYDNSNICTAPTLQASNIQFENLTDNSVALSWTNGNGDGRVVIINTTNNFTAPSNFSNPTASTVYTGGQQVIYNGNGNGPIVVTGLSHSTTYWFKVYEFCETDRIYQTSDEQGNPASIQTEVCVTAPGVDVIIACDEIIWIDGNTYSESNNSATFMLTNSQGCDSLVTLNFTLFEFDAEIESNGNILTASPSGGTYQWIDCLNEDTPIPGAVAQTYTPSQSGSYAVLVTLNGCTEDSDCINVTINEEPSSIVLFDLKNLSVFPNPAIEKAQLIGLPLDATIELVDVQGNLLMSQTATSYKLELDFRKFAQGIYFIRVISKQSGLWTEKLIVK